MDSDMKLTIVHSHMTIDDFLLRYKHHQLNLEPAFQRKSVWNISNRRFLIQSLLEGIPLPAIYLFKRKGPNGKFIYDVIDGKQRLESILLFLGTGPLSKTEDELQIKTTFDHEPAAWWSWKSLPKDKKYEIKGSKIPTIEVEGEFADIVNLFVRINSTGVKLTGQERRRATFLNNLILQTIQSLADSQEATLIRHGVISVGQVQRMRHVELMAELLLATHHKGPLQRKSELDRIIAGGGIAKGDLNQSKLELLAAMKIAFAMLPDIKSTRFRQIADFYTLVLLVVSLRSEGKAISLKDVRRLRLAGRILLEFGRGVDEAKEMNKKIEELPNVLGPHRKYLLTTREGTDTKTNRKQREAILRDVLEGVFDQKDENRFFNPTQRRILWHSSIKKKCALCKKPIEFWEDLHLDHIYPHVYGGKTDLKNAALSHSKCNKSKGAKQ